MSDENQVKDVKNVDLAYRPYTTISVYMQTPLLEKIENCTDFGDERSRAYKITRMLEFYFKYKDRINLLDTKK